MKLGVNISDFLEKQNYVDAVMEVTGSDKVVKSEVFATWLRTQFSEYPDKLQKIQDIAVDYLLSQQQKREAAAKPAKPKNSSTNATASERACPPKIQVKTNRMRTDTVGREHAASPTFDYSYVSPKAVVVINPVVTRKEPVQVHRLQV